MSNTILTKAADLKVGQTFTYGHHTYTVTARKLTRREDRQDPRIAEIEISTEGNTYAMGFYTDSDVHLHVTPEEYAAFQERRKELALARDRVYKLEVELTTLRNSNDPGRETMALIVWNETDAAGHTRRKSREYKTQAGLLRALIRMEGDIDRFQIVDVFEPA